MDESRSDVLILGAGISGLSAAYFLASQGHSVRVVDAYDHLGGNHISRNIGGYTYDIGAIFFWSDNRQFDMFEGLLDMCVPLDVSISKISPSGNIIQYPFSLRDEILNRGLLEQAASIGSLIKARLSKRDIRSAADFARFHMGTHLYERTGLRTYLDRFYGLSGEEVSLAFAERRMDWLRKYGSARYWLSRGLGAARVQMGGRAPHALNAYARPREGFQRSYGRNGECLSKMGVDIHLSNSIRSIDAAEHGHVVHSEARSFFGSRLISTMPVAMTALWAGLPVAGSLVSLNLTTLFCSYAGPSSFDGTVLYNFHPEGTWKRLTMHSAYYGPVAGRSYFAVECTHLADNVSARSLFDDFTCHVRKLRIFDGDLRLEGSMRLAHAYPVYRHGFEAALHPLIRELNSRGIEPLGRQGRFDYIPSSAMAIDLVRETLGT
jgi:protoporphyrinogen oxidase